MENVKIWIEDWCNLYPDNIKWNEVSIKSKSKDCVNKMIKFCKTYSQYTKDIIFAATKEYLKVQEAKNWEYTKRSTYFIDKQGEASLLAQFCQKQIEPVEEKKTEFHTFYNDFI